MTAQVTTPNPRRNPGDEMLTLQEAFIRLRVPEGTLRYWRHLGCGPRSFRSAATSATGAPTSSSGSPSRPTGIAATDSYWGGSPRGDLSSPQKVRRMVDVDHWCSTHIRRSGRVSVRCQPQPFRRVPFTNYR
jgi:hypothetical protein